MWESMDLKKKKIPACSFVGIFCFLFTHGHVGTGLKTTLGCCTAEGQEHQIDFNIIMTRCKYGMLC